MKRSSYPWLWLLAAGLAACGPTGSQDPDGGAPDSGGDASPLPDGPPATERECGFEVRFVPDGDHTGGFLAGEWDWTAREPLAGPEADGSYVLRKELPPGLYAYKVVIARPGGAEDWRLDPKNPYRKYDGGVENSGMRMPDCSVPELVLESFDTDGPGRTATARLRFHRARGGADFHPATLLARLRRDFQETVLDGGAITVSGAEIRIDVASLSPGKYTLLVDAADLDGKPAAQVMVPFWIEDQPFDWRDSPIYMIMVDRFRNGDPTNDGSSPGAEPNADWLGGDLAGVRMAIEDGTFDALGIKALWLSPFVQNTHRVHDENGAGMSGYHGYWPTAARKVEPRFGDEADLEKLVAAAHARGIRVLMDFVINHVHEDHEYVAAHPDWFRTGCVCGTAGCDWTEHRLDCSFHPYMPDVDWQNAEAAEQFLADAEWWLERFDLDGLRVDAVKHVEDLAVLNLSKRINERFEQGGVEYFLLGETAMGWAGHSVEANRSEYDTISRYIGEYALNGQFDFVLYHAASYNVFADDVYGLLHADFWARASQQNYPADAIMTPFIGSHDSYRFITKAQHHNDPIVFRRWSSEILPEAPTTDEPYGRMAVALGWVLSLPGAPLLYYGDEYGEFGALDPDNRHMWRPPAGRSPREAGLYETVRKILAARKDSVALRRGQYTTVHAEERFLAFARHTSTDVALIVLNHADQPATRELELPGAVPIVSSLTDEVGENGTVPVTNRRLTVTLPPRSVSILVP